MKIRLDKLLLEKKLAPSRQKAQALIGAGQVLVDEKRADKPGTLVDDAATVLVRETPPFVSRGGEKLAGPWTILGSPPPAR